MKRSELKRTGFTPKKRKPIAHKSKTNSHPHRNRSVISDYCETHSMCAMCKGYGEHVHHIFGGRARVDHVANVIVLCAACHGEMHKEPSAGKIRCLGWKLDHDEFDPASLYEIAGEHMAGWLARHPQSGQVESMRQRLLGVCLGSGE